jgi:hypothetical protein
MSAADQADAKLATQIVDAIKEYDAADATRKEKAIVAGRLLVEAHKRHPSQKAFAKFLQLAGGIKIRQAENFINFATGRKDYEQHQAENAAAQQKYRDKLKAEKIEREKAKAALPKPEPTPAPKPEPTPALRNATKEESEAADMAAGWSEQALGSWKAFCVQYLPQLNDADLKKASDYFNKGKWRAAYDALMRKRPTKEAA